MPADPDVVVPGPVVEPLLERCPFPPPGTVVDCAVSGGADSLALLVLACAAGCVVTAVHVDHGLRPGSSDEAAVVAAAAGRLGARFRAERVSVAPGPNLEARARAARYAALPPGVLTGHTADDLAETVLLNLIRGTGLTGLAAMAGDRRRPLLGLRRAETASLCAAIGLTPVDDPHNTDPTFRRVRVRTELLPLLDDIAERDVVPLVARLAETARRIEDHLEAEAAGLDPTDARALAAADRVVAATAVRRWLRSCSADRHPPDAAAVERVLAVARGEAVGTEVSGGWRVRRHGGRLTATPPLPPG